jgi:chaperonin GroEL
VLIKQKPKKTEGYRKPPPKRPPPGTPQQPVFIPRGEDKRRGVLFAPEVQRALKQGVETMTAPMAATLGPLGRTVAIASLSSNHAAPEILSDAATIARRVIEIPNRCANTGAMLIRNLAWQMRQTIGDGSATAAVLARALVLEGMRTVTAGANPVMICRGLEQGVRAAVAQLAEMSQPFAGRAAIAALSGSATGDQTLAELIAEILEIIGADGPVVIEEFAGAVMEREYVENIRWDSGLADTNFVTDENQHAAIMMNPGIVLADMEVTSASQVLPVVEQACKARAESLVLIARKIEGEALGTLLLNAKRTLPIAPITAPGLVLSRPQILQDLAILCGGTLIDEKAGRRLEEFRLEDFGGARRVVARRKDFTLISPRGNIPDIRGRIAELQGELAQESPTAQPDMLRRRLANLSGGTAILKIGAFTKMEGRLKRQLAEDAIRVVRAALKEGTVPGGGAAYLGCIPALQDLAKTMKNEDEAIGVRIAAAALTAPLQQIAANAGYEAATIVAKVRPSAPKYGFDALSGQIVEMRAAGIVDPTKVQRLTLEMAASTAAMILTTEAVVLTKRRGVEDVAFEP